MTSQRGFTLVELLISILLIGIIATALYNGLLSVLQLHAKAETLVSMNITENKMIYDLERDLKNGSIMSEITVDSNYIIMQSYNLVNDITSHDYLQKIDIYYNTQTDSIGRSIVNRITASAPGEIDTISYIFPEGYYIRFNFTGSSPNIINLDIFQNQKDIPELIFQYSMLID